MTLRPSILNREFKHPVDGWYHIEPMGEHPNAAAQLVQVIDPEAVGTIVNRFNGAADAGQLSHGSEMLIDHEHFSHDPDKETTAYGWLGKLQGRADGIYGQIRWTNTGKPAVDGGDFRFFSTEYDPEKLAIVNRDKKRVRPLELVGLTLTNRPNNRGGKPITNTLSQTGTDPHASGNQAANQRKQTMKLIANRLGLSADASEEACLGELSKLLDRATGAETKLAPVTTERDSLKNRVTELLDEQIDADLDASEIKDEGVRGKLKPVLATMKNRADRVEFLGLMAKPEKKAEGKGPLTNRQTARTPALDLSDANKDAAATKRATLITNRAAQIQKASPHTPLSGAFIRATTEIDNELAAGVAK
jgi:phage I-like protein